MEGKALDEIMRSDKFYTEAAKYWDNIPATVDGMLGGFGFISQIDIQGSTIFLKALFKLTNPPSKTFALDCGAGIGRITKNLLIKHFKEVDLVEQNPKFLEKAKSYLGVSVTRVGEFFPTGLQHFCPTIKKYDVIWCQWVLGHLRDDDLVQFFINCASGLRDNGVLVVKENVTNFDKIDVDTNDSSVTRSLKELEKAFEKAGLVCIKKQQQQKMPHGLYPVFMFALRSKIDATTESLQNG